MNDRINTSMQLMPRWFVRNVVVCCCLVGSTASCAEDGPYCGIYAMFGAAAALDVQGDIETLIDPQFVSGRTGSTVADLVRAAEKLGVKAQPLAGLGVASLLESRDPLVLHVASFGQLEAYNHWLLFLGMQNGKARTVDSSGRIHLMQVAELLARWDGVGLAVHTGNEPLTRFGSVELARTGWTAMAVLSCLAGLVVLQRKVTGWLPPRWQGLAVLVTASAVLLIVRELDASTSLWRNPACVEFVQAAHGHRSYPELSLEEMQQRLTQPGPLLVFDTRYSGDMQWGHLPGALPLPIDSTQSQVADAMAAFDRGTPVIVYCQSAGCRFSDRMAVVLTSFGFTDVSIYRGGWVEWEESLTAEDSVEETPTLGEAEATR
jgi:rhodanese-related sulfurtransferase